MAKPSEKPTRAQLRAAERMAARIRESRRLEAEYEESMDERERPAWRLPME